MQSRVPNMVSTTAVVLALSIFAIIITHFVPPVSEALANSSHVLLRAMKWLLPDLLYLLFPAVLLREPLSLLRTVPMVLSVFLLYESSFAVIMQWQSNSKPSIWFEAIHLTALYKGALMGIGWAFVFREVWVSLPLLCAACFYIQSVGTELALTRGTVGWGIYITLSPVITLLPSVAWLEHRAWREPPHPPSGFWDSVKSTL